MISEVASLVERSSRAPTAAGIDAYLGQFVDEYWPYGSGKAALRDGLAIVAHDGGNVLLPSYLPDGVVEPIRELGLDTRYYAICDDLAPDVTDLEARIDDETVAITSVNYFGFPQPGIDRIGAIATAHDCYHVDDNAHSPFSVHEGRLLGTMGDIGITSLWKILSVPNGAFLYLPNRSLSAQFEPSPLCGVADRFDSADARFVVRRVLEDAPFDEDVIMESLATAFGGDSGDGRADTEARYESAKRCMSKLTDRMGGRIDPSVVRTRRRKKYRYWLESIEHRSDARPFYPELPPGICPQRVPVYAERPEQFERDLTNVGVDGVHTWPRLSDAVENTSAYETATTLSRHLFVLPIHDRIEADRIAAIGRELRDRSSSREENSAVRH